VQGCYYPKFFNNAVDEPDSQNKRVLTKAEKRRFRYSTKYYHYYIGHYDKEKYKERMKKYKEHKIKSRPNGRTWCHISSAVKFYRNNPSTDLPAGCYHDSLLNNCLIAYCETYRSKYYLG
jgi:hypothetical protein